MVVKQMIEASMKKSADIRRTRLLHVSTSTLQIMDTGRFTQVTPRSATAKERMNQFVVVCNLLLLAMIKITQLFPNKPNAFKDIRDTPYGQQFHIKIKMFL